MPRKQVKMNADAKKYLQKKLEKIVDVRSLTAYKMHILTEPGILGVNNAYYINHSMLARNTSRRSVEKAEHHIMPILKRKSYSSSKELCTEMNSIDPKSFSRYSGGPRSSVTAALHRKIWSNEILIYRTKGKHGHYIYCLIDETTPIPGEVFP